MAEDMEVMEAPEIPTPPPIPPIPFPNTVNGDPMVDADYERWMASVAATIEGERADAGAYEAQAELIRPYTAEEVLGRLIRSVSVLLAALPDSTLARMPWAFEPWAAGTTYLRGALVSHGERVWRSTRAHTSAEATSPGCDGAPWEMLVDEWGGATVWVQPAAGHGYAVGDRVIWAYRLWESEVADNIYLPGVYGWRAV